jgi:hypothetical protein
MLRGGEEEFLGYAPARTAAAPKSKTSGDNTSAGTSSASAMRFMALSSWWLLVGMH